jgi:hypothetical protein
MQIRSVSVFMLPTARMPGVLRSGVSNAPTLTTLPNTWIRIMGMNR